MSVRRTLLAVHAHPDDETITMGGTLARYSAAGVRTVVVTCTTGDLGEVAPPTRLAAGETVATLREAELRAATARLGVSRLVQLGYGDSGMPGEPANARPGAFAGVPLDAAATRLADVVRTERPQVLIAYDATGGYGHPDHIRAHQVANAAYALLDASDRPLKLYYVCFPLGWSRGFVAALRAAGIDAPGSAPAGADAGPGVTEIGVPDATVTTVLDVRDYARVKYAALACHHSQMPPDHFLMRMSPELVATQWAHEFFSRQAGPTDVHPGQTETDLFAGLDG
jgi:LmbE family N-acetylglucosaminyl deacetylase